MAVDIGPKIGIDGEREFRYQIQQTNQALKTLAAEERAVVSAFDDEADAEKKAAAQKDVLNRQIETQRDKLKLLEKGLQESAAMYGESDTRTMKWQEAVHTATATLNKMESELARVDDGVDEATDSLEEAGNAATSWADVMKGSLCADMVKAGLQKTVELIKSMSTAFWDASKAGAAYADEILTLATTSGLAVDTLQEYRYMADLVDVSVDTITGSLTKLTSSMNKARDDEGDTADAFRQLGVTIKDQNGALRKNSDVFNDVIDALGQIGNETERDALAMTVFGKSAKDLNPLIAAGSEKLQDLAKEAHDTGYVLDNTALEALGRQQDAMDRFAKKTEAVGNAFAVNMAPGIEKAYNTMSEVFDNPRVERGFNAISESIGNVISGAADLAAQVLPELFSVFNFGDERLRLYNETQLELVNTAEELKSSHENLMAEYRGKAEGIVEETERIQNLWAELTTLADETGKVNDADKERVDYILKELNDALDTEYERNGNIIAQYQEMQKEIRNIIKEREAEKLLAAYEEKYTQARENMNNALQKAGALYPQVQAAQEAYNQAVADLAAFWAANEDAYNEADEAGEDAILRKAQQFQKAKADAEAALKLLQQDYDEASASAQGYYETVDRYERAQSAMLQENYVDVVRILADELGVTMDYYRRKKELNEQDKKDLQDKIDSASLAIEEYKRNLKAGLVGFSETGLKELQDYVDEAKRILDGKAVADYWVAGLIKGLNNKENLDKIEKASYTTANTIIKTTKVTMQIKSPSRVAAQIGEMWDAGLVKGIEDREAELSKAAAGLADTIITSSTPSGAVQTGYGNAMTASGAYGGTGTSSYTTNMGGIAVYVNGAGAVNEEALAQQIAVQLTDQLQRAQRGGRR